MCAILGSKDISMFEVLYEANKVRGAFASSICAVVVDEHNDPCDFLVNKYENIADLSKVNIVTPDNQIYNMGHFQAPTSAKRKWEYDTSHPFETIDWCVAHNGVITNFETLNEKYTPWNVNPVDTSVIVSMLQTEYENRKDTSIKGEYKILETVLARLEGTFAIFIVNANNWNTYICRQGSTLFFDDHGNFSSIRGKDMVEVPEGKIFQIVNDYGSFKQVGSFKSKSPFLII